MGSTTSTGAGKALGAKSTAKEVLEHYAHGGNVQGFLLGKTAIVTNSGIGLETCKVLAYAGCRVIMGSRTVSNGEKAMKEEIQQKGHGGYVVEDVGNIVVLQFDLENLKVIKSFADEILKTESRIDFLICNGAIMMLPKLEHNEYGWERQIGTNHFGHFYLISLLREKMVKQSHPSRIVVVASRAHLRGPIDLSDLHFKHGREYDRMGMVAYAQAKKANMLCARSLADQLKDTQVRCVSLHPGAIATNLQKHLNFFVWLYVSWFLIDKTIPQGAATHLYAMLSPDLHDKPELRGVYLADCGVATEIDEQAKDADGKLRAELWRITEERLQEALLKQNT